MNYASLDNHIKIRLHFHRSFNINNRQYIPLDANFVQRSFHAIILIYDVDYMDFMKYLDLSGTFYLIVSINVFSINIHGN